MIEPTESETKSELDRFCSALLAIRAEIEEVITGAADTRDNVLKNAPHTAEVVISDSWNRSYSREKAAWPLPWVKDAKVWPTVSRIDGAYGDRNLICTCVAIEEYAEN
jgi:glycine dehydrogenase